VGNFPYPNRWAAHPLRGSGGFIRRGWPGVDAWVSVAGGVAAMGTPAGGVWIVSRRCFPAPTDVTVPVPRRRRRAAFLPPGGRVPPRGMWVAGPPAVPETGRGPSCGSGFAVPRCVRRLLSGSGCAVFGCVRGLSSASRSSAGSPATALGGGAPSSAAGARSPANIDQPRRSSPYDNQCPRTRGRPHAVRWKVCLGCLFRCLEGCSLRVVELELELRVAGVRVGGGRCRAVA
jgi:hypothetical protein